MGLFGRRTNRNEPAFPTVDFAEVEHIYGRRFAGTDRDQFVRLWCEVAHVCGKAPTELHEDEVLADRPPSELFLDDRMEELVALALRNSKGKPKGKIDTVGTLLDFLLDEQ